MFVFTLDEISVVKANVFAEMTSIPSSLSLWGYIYQSPGLINQKLFGNPLPRVQTNVIPTNVTNTESNNFCFTPANENKMFYPKKQKTGRGSSQFLY
jgi:hypothetical protein